MPRGMKSQVAHEVHEAAFAEIIKLIGKYEDSLARVELLALSANITGRLIAMQDQRKYTAQELMIMVADNIELGNQQARDELLNTKGNA